MTRQEMQERMMKELENLKAMQGENTITADYSVISGDHGPDAIAFRQFSVSMKFYTECFDLFSNGVSSVHAYASVEKITPVWEFLPMLLIDLSGENFVTITL